MANIVTRYYNLNIAPGDTKTIVHLSQYENGRILVFRLFGNGDFGIPEGSTAVLEGTKPDGNVYSVSGEVNAEEKTVTIQEEVQLTAVAGEYKAKIKVMNGANKVATGIIRLIISPDTVEDGAVESESDLQGLIAEAVASAQSASESADRAEHAAIQSGYLFFFIEEGKLYMDRTENTRVDFYLEDGKLYVREEN